MFTPGPQSILRGTISRTISECSNNLVVKYRQLNLSNPFTKLLTKREPRKRDRAAEKELLKKRIEIARYESQNEASRSTLGAIVQRNDLLRSRRYGRKHPWWKFWESDAYKYLVSVEPQKAPIPLSVRIQDAIAKLKRDYYGDPNDPRNEAKKIIRKLNRFNPFRFFQRRFVFHLLRMKWTPLTFSIYAVCFGVWFSSIRMPSDYWFKGTMMTNQYWMGEYWRAYTASIHHYYMLHMAVATSIWLSYARAIELSAGKLVLAVLFVSTALITNTASILKYDDDFPLFAEQIHMGLLPVVASLIVFTVTALRYTTFKHLQLRQVYQHGSSREMILHARWLLYSLGRRKYVWPIAALLFSVFDKTFYMNKWNNAVGAAVGYVLGRVWLIRPELVLIVGPFLAIASLLSTFIRPTWNRRYQVLRLGVFMSRGDFLRAEMEGSELIRRARERQEHLKSLGKERPLDNWLLVMVALTQLACGHFKSAHLVAASVNRQGLFKKKDMYDLEHYMHYLKSELNKTKANIPRAYTQEQIQFLHQKLEKLQDELNKSKELYEKAMHTTGWSFLNDSQVLDVFNRAFGYVDQYGRVVPSTLSDEEKQQLVLDSCKKFFSFEPNYNLKPKIQRIKERLKAAKRVIMQWNDQWKAGRVKFDHTSLTPFYPELRPVPIPVEQTNQQTNGVSVKGIL